MTKKKKTILTLATISAIVGGLGLFAFLGGTAIFGATATFVADIGIAGIGAGIFGLVTVATMGVVGTVRLKRLQSQEKKYFYKMDKMQNSKERQSTKTEQARAKISKKYATAHLKLAKLARVDKKGNVNLHNLTGHRHNVRERGVYADVMNNKKEAYMVASQNALASGKSSLASKWAKKADNVDRKLNNKTGYITVDTQYQWVRTVRDPYTGKNIQDHRTEIHCHNEETKKAFMELSKGQEINKEVGFASKVVFPDESKLISTFASVNDQKLNEKAELLLLQEARHLVDEYNDNIFPLKVLRVDLNNGKSSTKIIEDYQGLNDEIEMLIDSENKVKKGSFLNRQYKEKKEKKDKQISRENNKTLDDEVKIL